MGARLNATSPSSKHNITHDQTQLWGWVSVDSCRLRCPAQHLSPLVVACGANFPRPPDKSYLLAARKVGTGFRTSRQDTQASNSQQKCEAVLRPAVRPKKARRKSSHRFFRRRLPAARAGESARPVYVGTRWLRGRDHSFSTENREQKVNIWADRTSEAPTRQSA